LGFLANYRLVKTGSMEKDGDFYKISVQNLMGDNPHFESDHVVLRTPLETTGALLECRGRITGIGSIHHPPTLPRVSTA
jgi:hypothetical protein